MPATSEVPEDIIISIITELSIDRQTLEACASVARPFRVPAQRHLYSDIALDLGSHPSNIDRVKQLNFLFTENPQLCTYVRSLSLRFIPDDAQVPYGVFLELSQLRKLELNFRPNQLNMVRWKDLPRRLQTEFYHLMQSPHLRQLTLVWINGFPVTHLPHNGLHQLIIEDAYLFKDASASIPIDSLRILRFDCTLLRTDFVETCQTIVDLLPGCLEHFALLVNNAFLCPEFHKLDLTALRHLRSLQLGYMSPLHSAVHRLKEFVERSLPNHSLKRMTIIRTTMSFFGGKLRDVDRLDLNAIDKVLANAPRLNRVHISLSVPPALDSLLVEEIIIPQIPLLAKRGGVSIYAKDQQLLTFPWRQDMA
ncbi:hypothetical protein Hypma_014245 [Hypsizygus marmoreus]|uniref:F-box domain-containing protein n=1 Tax=Hypsizygus marmoreus TaxID=39966 RepID=A0A369JAM4_HYPMA|nr:hypothetical protein Hypma_014245 [Hypsizygus marmoreus]